MTCVLEQKQKRSCHIELTQNNVSKLGGYRWNFYCFEQCPLELINLFPKKKIIIQIKTMPTEIMIIGDQPYPVGMVPIIKAIDATNIA